MYSVVIPAFNSSKTIRQSIESVLRQTRLDLIKEIIVVDDGSTDDTGSIVKQMKTEIDNRISYFYQENAGASAARNKGIMIASSEWVALLDSDDIWLPKKIEKQDNVLRDNPQICFLGSHYPFKIWFQEREGLIKVSAKDLCVRSMPYTPSVVFKKEIGMKYGLFKEGMKYGEDANFFQKFLLEDSYYIMAEKLVEIDIGKSFYGESGMTSHLSEMYKGKIENMKELYKFGLISETFLSLMILLCHIKRYKKIIQRYCYKNLRLFIVGNDI